MVATNTFFYIVKKCICKMEGLVKPEKGTWDRVTGLENSKGRGREPGLSRPIKRAHRDPLDQWRFDIR